MPIDPFRARLAALLLVAPAVAALPVVALPVAAQESDEALLARARALHERVLTLDTHVDINPVYFRTDAPNYAQRLPRTQVDLAKMEAGGLDAAFLIVYVGQRPDLTPEGFARAREQALEKFAAIHRLVDTLAPDRAGLALTSADARRLHAEGKRAIFIGIENGFPIGTELENLRRFHALGGRYMSLAHNGHSQLADSNTGERDGVWQWNGLSPLGREVVAEMNRLGMMIDISHPSKAAMLEIVRLTRAPIIASHSGVRAICDHSRNLDDEQLDAMKANGGVVQLVAFNSYVKCDRAKDAAREAAVAALRAEYGITARRRDSVQLQIEALPEARRNAYLAAQEDIVSRRYPADPASTVADFVDHIDYVVRRIGVEHAGISSDFDGGGGVEGWRDASQSLAVTVELLRRGYSEEDVAKIWGGNLLRVLDAVQAHAARAAN
jgi:membrane dipeptidase